MLICSMLHQADSAPPKHASQNMEGCPFLDPEITAPHHHPTAVLTEQSLPNLHKAAELAHPPAEQSSGQCLMECMTGCNIWALAPALATAKPAAPQTADKAKCTVLAQGHAPGLRKNTWEWPKAVPWHGFSQLPQAVCKQAVPQLQHLHETAWAKHLFNF